MEHKRNPRAWALLIVVFAALAGAGCYLEQRSDGKWWACDTVQTPSGPITACQPLEMMVTGR